jgi:hypothetical protein
MIAPGEVATDSSVAINLIHVDLLRLLGHLPDFSFVVPETVVSEISHEAQRERLEDAIQQGFLRRTDFANRAEMAAFDDLQFVVGPGEAACLVIAEHRGWIVASDEKRRFRREAIARVGLSRLLTTAGIFVLAIRAGVLTVEEADEAKALLERHRFRIGFGSFRELLDPE